MKLNFCLVVLCLVPWENILYIFLMPWTMQKRGREELPLARARPWGATPCPWSGVGTESTRLRQRRSSGGEELHVQGKGRQPEELPHPGGQGPRLRGATPLSRSCWAGAGGPRGSRGAPPRSRSGGAAVRKYPSCKVRSSGCALLEQRWRDTHVQGKRNSSKTVGVVRGHQRAETLKP